MRALIKVVISMLFAVAFIPWFPAKTPGRTLFMLFVLRPLLDISLAGLVLHAIQVPYRALNWTPITWLGRISYSLYLWQELFCSNAAYHLGYSLILPSVACACVSYYAVEKPMLRLRDRLFTDSVPSHASIPLAGAEASFATAQL